jgi:hypothetical protein
MHFGEEHHFFRIFITPISLGLVADYVCYLEHLFLLTCGAGRLSSERKH